MQLIRKLATAKELLRYYLERKWFWQTVGWELNRLKIDGEARAKIEESIARKIPKPTEADVAAYRKEYKKREGTGGALPLP
jgi:hypothetical protein